jgi:deoxyribodipyrimidine photolyase-related protein
MCAKRIILILGDQLDEAHPALPLYDADTDIILMIESAHEASYVWSHKARIAIFLSAMRHYGQNLSNQGYKVRYTESSPLSVIEVLQNEIQADLAEHLILVTPGEWRLKTNIETLASQLNIRLTMLEDTHFYCSIEAFNQWAENKRELRLEYFYREMRKKHQILMNPDGTPLSGQWNFDHQNRRPFSKQGPGLIPPPLFFKPDATTQAVLTYVNQQYAHHPGSLKAFAWPVTREEALAAMRYFVRHRIRHFGLYQDAMWTNTPFGWHSILSVALNLKLLNPREVVHEVLVAYKEENLELATVEGFIRQIIGWREFIRGVYYRDMPKLASQNFFHHERPLPSWYWSGNTNMQCMRDTIGQTLEYGYAHHIQRLMVTGNFALLAEILPKAVSDWYLAVYVDAIEWVEMPNVLGMALFANGGRFTSKPYIASGAYIQRMSNYCEQCCYKPNLKLGEQACPITTLYWNFLIKHEVMLNKNPRTRLMTANLKRLSDFEKNEVVNQANLLLSNLDNL